MLDRTVTAHVLERIELDVPIVDLVAAHAQEIAEHVLAGPFGAASGGNGDEIARGRELMVESVVDGVDDSLRDVGREHACSGSDD